MHNIEPYYNWRNLYIASEDALSPFYEREYSEFEYTNKIYNYLIHPQWDYIGSETLYIKIIYADYNEGFTINVTDYLQYCLHTQIIFVA